MAPRKRPTLRQVLCLAGVAGALIACPDGSSSGPQATRRPVGPPASVPSQPGPGFERGEPPTPRADMGQTAPPDMGVPRPDLGGPQPDLGPLPPAASRPLQFKKFDQLRTELARILELPADGLCNELGRYSCTDEAHRVVLGGPKATPANIYWGDSLPGPTTPIAFERVVLAACTRRADLEVQLAPSDRAFLQGVEISENQLDPDSEGARDGMRRLFQRALLRSPSSTEEAAIIGLYDDIATVNQLDPARTWFQSVCGGLLSSTEFAFY